jgi:hypothetical protein
MEPNEIAVPDDLSMVADAAGAESLGQLSSCGTDSTQGIVVEGSVVRGPDEWDWFEIVLADDIGGVGILALVHEGDFLYEFDALDPLSPTAYIFVEWSFGIDIGLIGDAQPDVILGPFLPAGTSILIGVRADYPGQIRYD